MKTIISLCLLLSINTFAATDTQKLCQLLEGETLELIYMKDVVANDFNWWEIERVMDHVLNHNLIDEITNDTDFADVVAHYKDYGWDELSFALYRDPATGKKYSYVWSYPGDNEFGSWYDRSANVIASNGDGDVYIGDEWCGHHND